jgi:hypothetical protein
MAGAIQENDLHDPWNDILNDYVKNGGVSYGKLKSSERDMQKLDNYLEALGKADVKTYSRDERLAFWINAYNAFTVKLILNHYPLKSIRDIKKPWKRKIWLAAGEQLSLNDMEHQKLRNELQEPRIHFAIVCASIGCPELYNNAFRAKNLDQTLDKVARSFFSAHKNIIVELSGDNTILHLSRIFKWFGKDFGKNDQERIEFILPYLNKADTGKINNAKKIKIKFLDYDWSLNGK